MKTHVALLTIVLALSLAAVPLSAQSAPSELAPLVATHADRLVAQHDDPSAHLDELWLEARTAHGHVTLLIDYASKQILAVEEGRSKLAWKRLLANLQRRDGRFRAAIKTLNSIASDDRSVNDRMALAETQDANGDTAAALKAYENLLASELDRATRNTILLRCALMQTKRTEALAKFVKEDGHTTAQANAASVVLALLNDQRTAIDAYVLEGESTQRFRREVRLAEWSIECKDFDRAQEFSWAALKSAKLKRDRRYALTLLASSYRRDKALSELLERFSKAESLKDDERKLWIELLREEGRVDEALTLFQGKGSLTFSPQMRRQLLEICRETGREETLVSAFGDLIAGEPDNLEWRSGLSRYYLENGNREAAVKVWEDFGANSGARELLAAAHSLNDIGLDDIAERLARIAGRQPKFTKEALFFIFKSDLALGLISKAEKSLHELTAIATPDSSLQAEIADGYERIGRPELAVQSLETLRGARGGFLGTDLEMKYAILLSKIGRESDALKIWRELWVRLRSTPRARFVEDRMMTVASRLGVLAKIAIELEDRLATSDAGDQDIDLLVRLYIKVGDPASATEILEEYMRSKGDESLEITKRKSKIYLSCNDYYNYERLVGQLVKEDEESRLDHLHELAMSRLERGRRDLAIELLPTIREASGSDTSIADEFEAGIYGIVGMKDEALVAYLRGMGRHPERIDTYLLISNLLRETGEEMRAVRIFQHMAQTAQRDDLFTIAVDALLNLRAPRRSRVPDSAIKWALRTALERLAQRPHRFFLYRLTADLAEELKDLPMAIRTLKAGLPVAGERRTAIMREIMGKAASLDPGARRIFGQTAFKPSKRWDATEYLMVGRRLLGQGDHVPPSIFMNLAAIFIRQGDVPAAKRTFSRAAEHLEYAEVAAEAARVLEEAGKIEPALTYYRRLLATSPNDPNLMMKVGNLEEELGRNGEALAQYRRAFGKVLNQKASFATHQKKKASNKSPYGFLLGGNVDEATALQEKLARSLLVTLGPENASDEFLSEQEQAIELELGELENLAADSKLIAYPRLLARVSTWRKIVLAEGLLDRAELVDKKLLSVFSGDRDLALTMVKERRSRGYILAAQKILALSAWNEDPYLRGQAGILDREASHFIPMAALAANLMPKLGSDPTAIKRLLERCDTSQIKEADLNALPVLLGACILTNDRENGERLLRSSLRRIKLKNTQDQRFLTVMTLANRLDNALARRLYAEQIEARLTELPQFIYRLTQLETTLGGNIIDGDVAFRIIDSTLRDPDKPPSTTVLRLLAKVDSERRASLVRELYRAMPASRHVYLITQAMNCFDDSVDDSFVDWMGQKLAEKLSDGDVARVYLPTVNTNDAQFVPSAKLRLKIAQCVAKYAPDDAVYGIIAECLKILGRDDEALAIMRDQKKQFFATGYQSTRARNKIAILFESPEERKKLADFVDEMLKAEPKNKFIESYKWDLVRYSPNYEAMIRKALEADRTNLPLLNRFIRHLRSENRYAEAAETLKLMHKALPKDANIKRQLATMYRLLKNPLAAEKITGKKTVQADPRSSSLKQAVAATRLLPASGTSIAVPMTQVISQLATRRPNAAQQPNKIEEQIKSGDEKGARLALRARWRGFRGVRALSSRYGFPTNMLLRYSAPIGVPRNTKAITAFGTVKSDKPWFAEEARLALKTLSGEDGMGADEIRNELLEIIGRCIDENELAKTIKELAKKVHESKASSDDVDLYLRLLIRHKEYAHSSVSKVAARPENPGRTRLELLSFLLSKCNQSEQSEALFRMGILLNSQSTFVRTNRNTLIKDTVGRIEDAVGKMDNELLVALIEDLISSRTSSYDATSAASQAIDYWCTRLSPAEAARCAQKFANLLVTSTSRNSRTDLQANKMAAVMARAGEYEQALEFVTLALTYAPDWAYSSPMTKYRPISKNILDAMAPKDGNWVDRKKWCQVLFDRVKAWNAAGKLRSPVAVFATLAVASHQSELSELSLKCGQLATEHVEGRSDLGLVLRMHKQLGNDERAFAIEAKMLKARSLNINLITPHLEALALEDPEQALAAAEKAATYTLEPKLLEFLIEASKAAGKSDRVTHWQEILNQVQPKKKAEESEKQPSER